MTRIKLFLRGLWFDFKYRNQPRGYCCCGDRIEEHGFGCGHSPVDEYYYHRDLYVNRK
jgi:hypothetical protein